MEVVEFLTENDYGQITVDELCEKIKERLEGTGEETFSCRYMKAKLDEQFGDQIVSTNIVNKPNVVTFTRNRESYFLRTKEQQ